MSADINKTDIVVLSVVRHLEQALSGWNGLTVKAGNLPLDKDPPIIAVKMVDEQHHHFETGSTSRIGHYFIEINVKGATANQCANIRNDVVENLHTIALINFRTAMPGDGGYDEAAQTLCYANPGQAIKNKVTDEIEYKGRVSCILRPSGPFTLT